MTSQERDDAELREHLWTALKATSDLHIALIRALDGMDVWERTPTRHSRGHFMALVGNFDLEVELLLNCASWQDAEPSQDEDE